MCDIYLDESTTTYESPCYLRLEVQTSTSMEDFATPADWLTYATLLKQNLKKGKIKAKKPLELRHNRQWQRLDYPFAPAFQMDCKSLGVIWV